MGFQILINTTSGGNSSSRLQPVGDGATFPIAKAAARNEYQALEAAGETVSSVNVVDAAGAVVYRYP